MVPGFGRVMKLYTSANSPFGVRVAIAARAKGVALEEAPLPPGGLRSAEFLALNPIAKIPVLVTDRGTVLPESETILRYLEARHPEPSLYPPDPDARARMDGAARIMDIYVMAPVIRLFPHLDPAQRDEGVVGREVTRWRDGLAALAAFMRTPLSDAPAGVSLADCVLAPSFHLCTRIAAMLELEDDPISAHEGLVSYYRYLVRNPLAGPALEALTTAQAAADRRAGRPSIAWRHRSLADMP